jgi:hypothetical protein
MLRVPALVGRLAFDPVQQVVVGFRDRPGGREKQGVVRSEKSDTCLEGWFVMPGVGRVRNAVLTIALAGAAVFSVGTPTASAQPVERSHDRGTFTVDPDNVCGIDVITTVQFVNNFIQRLGRNGFLGFLQWSQHRLE